jgi:lysozyme family protein
MSDTTISIQKTLLHEGGYVNDPNDSGGATNFGITQADMPGVNIQTLTRAQAVTYYSLHYVKPYYPQIENQLVLDKLFDMGVLFGVGTAVGLLQRALGLAEDKVFGPQTLASTNDYGPGLLPKYETVLTAHAIAVEQANPKDAEFIQGWESRVNA